MKKYLLSGVINGHEVQARKFDSRSKAEVALMHIENVKGLERDWDEMNGHDHVYRYAPRTWFHITRVA